MSSPQYEQPKYGQPHQHEGEAEDEPRMEFEAIPQGFSEGPYELLLLPNFGIHVACRLWVDPKVSIIALFTLMIFHLLFYLLYLFHVYFKILKFMLEYFMFILLFLTELFFFLLYFSFNCRIC